MRSRNIILSRVSKLNLESIPLNNFPSLPESKPINIKTLQENVEKSGASFVMGSPSLAEIVDTKYKNAVDIVSSIEEIHSTFIVNKNHLSRELEHIGLTILKGTFIVEENGAVWLDEADMIHRALFSITNDLILVVNKENIVKNMHEAYSQNRFKVGNNGIFISGPTKTADIEQALVIGAQGAMSLLVYLK